MQFRTSVLLLLIFFVFQKSNGQVNKKKLEMKIEDFEKNNHLEWRIINDDVMGGISTSKIELLNDNKAKFSGNVSLENYGGFASVRGLLNNKTLTPFDKIKIRVKGDGKKYDFRIRTSNNFDGMSYKIEFQTKKDKWTTHVFLLSDFVPTFRGRILKNIPPIGASKIKQIGFLIAAKQEGEFELILDYLIGIE